MNTETKNPVGRKPIHDVAKVHVWCRLSQPVLDWIKAQDESGGELIDAAVRRCPAFMAGEALLEKLVMPAPRPINTGFRVTVEVAAWLKANGVGPIIETMVRERCND